LCQCQSKGHPLLKKVEIAQHPLVELLVPLKQPAEVLLSLKMFEPAHPLVWLHLSVA